MNDPISSLVRPMMTSLRTEIWAINYHVSSSRNREEAKSGGCDTKLIIVKALPFVGNRSSLTPDAGHGVSTMRRQLARLRVPYTKGPLLTLFYRFIVM